MTDLSCPLCDAAPEKAKLACPCCKRAFNSDWQPSIHMLDLEKVHCQACEASFPSYLLGQETRALIAGVKKALKEQDEGRNSSCWPLVSFGWKDADLDAEGCTGIKRIVDAVEDKLIFEIGGHKTFVSSDCLDTSNEKKRKAFDSAMQDIVCSTGFNAEWTGDDWCVSFSSVVAVPITFNRPIESGPGNSPDFEATAKQIISDAEQACRRFEEEMASASEAAEKLYIEMAAPEKKSKTKKAKPKTKKAKPRKK